MEKRKNPFRNIQLVLVKSPRTLKLMLVVLIVFSMVALAALSWVRSGIQAQTDALRSEAAALEQENADMADKIANKDSVQGVVDIAKDELGLVDPDTVVIKPN